MNANVKLAARSDSFTVKYTDERIDSLRAEVRSLHCEIERRESHNRVERLTIRLAFVAVAVIAEHYATFLPCPEIVIGAIALAPEAVREVVEFIRKI